MNNRLEVPMTVMPKATPRGPLRRGCPYIDGVIPSTGRLARRRRRAEERRDAKRQAKAGGRGVSP